MKALVISGGGAKGAWAGGVTEYLYTEQHKRWDLFLGSSTGSLLSFKLPMYDFKDLRNLYTGVNNDSIFSVKPFKDNGKLRILNAIWRLIRNKKSLGEFGNLRKLLKQNLTIQDFYDLQKMNETVFIAASDYSNGHIRFFSSKDKDFDLLGSNYEQFINAIIASASVPVVVNPVKIYDKYYLDGGVIEHIPIKKAIIEGASEIDVIILRPENQIEENWKPKNMFDIVLRSIDLLQREVSYSDVEIAKLMSQIKKDVKINYYYTPYELSRNSLSFDKKNNVKMVG